MLFFFKLNRDKYETFNPCHFNQNAEDYFELLQRRKLEKEDYFLPCKNFKLKRHKKIIATAKGLGGWVFFNF